MSEPYKLIIDYCLDFPAKLLLFSDNLLSKFIILTYPLNSF